MHDRHSSSSSSSSSDSSSDDGAESSSAWQRKQPFAKRRGDNSAFDDYDDDEDDRVASRSYLRDHQDYDLGEGTSRSKTASAIDQEAEDDGFDPFADSQAAEPSPYLTPSGESRRFSFDDNFDSFKHAEPASKPQKLTPADWNSAFKSEFDDFEQRDSFDDFDTGSSPAHTPGDELDDDDFGDFTTSESTAAAGDYDFSLPAAPSHTSSALATSPRGRPPLLGTSPKSTPADFAARRRSIDTTMSPVLSPNLAPVMSRRLSVSSNPGEEVRGPGIHEGAHISADGHHVEAEVEVDGQITKVQVPLDEIALHGPEGVS